MRRELNLVWCLCASLSLSSYGYVRCAERLLAGKGSDWNIARRFELGSIATKGLGLHGSLLRAIVCVMSR